MRQALRHLHFERVVGGVAQIAMTRHCIELWIEHKEILREQPAVSHKTAALIRDARVAVKEIRELTDIAVGDKRSSVRVRAQRCGSRNRRAVDRARPEIETPQHIVEQRCVTAAPGCVERIEKSVPEICTLLSGSAFQSFVPLVPT